MSEEKKTGSEATSGSPAVDPNKIGESTTQNKEQQTNTQTKPSEEMVPKQQYAELEKKIGSQGEELGKYRDYLEQITPILEKLEDQPEIVNAIMEGKIDAKLAKAVSEGKVSAEDAKTVSDAHEEVKEDLGKKEYDKVSTKDVEKLVEAKLEKKLEAMEKKVDSNLSDAEKLREYENRINNFIANTPDFSKYAEAVDKIANEYPNVDDVKALYEIAKGRESKKEEDEKAAEAAKEIAANAGGGTSPGTAKMDSKELADKFIGGRRSPNIF